MIKDIKKLKNKYEGKDAIFYASGPSHLKHKEFNQISERCIKFGINYIFENISNTDFLFVGEYETFLNVKKHYKEDKIIIPNVNGLNKHGTSNRIRIKSGKFFQYKIQDPLKNKQQDLHNKYYGNKDQIGFISYTTTTQSAIHILCYMGFKRIFLLGVDYKLYDNNKVHFESKISSNYSNQNWNALQRMKNGDQYIFNQLEKNFNCKIINLNNIH